MKKVVHTVCSHDCPDACGILVTVEDGRAMRVQGDPAHPVTQGFLCAKVTKYLERVYSPDRVLYPMRRTAPKGEGKGDATDFTRISWDEALDQISRRFKKISAEFGPEAILPYSYAGNMGLLSYSGMAHRFFYRLGASQLDRTICASAGSAGLQSVIGPRSIGTEPQFFRESKYIIAWGANIHATNVHLWPFIEEARRKGAKLVVIDPYKTRTARVADWHLPINPGTDVALALGMMHVIINERLYNGDYVSQYTLGFEQLKQKAQEYPPERVAEWTGISAEDIRKLAREYATVRPAIIRVNYGIQRAQNGGSAMRAVTMLPCLTGSWAEVGGGLQLSTSGTFFLNMQALERPDLMQKSPLGRPTRIVNMSELGKALNQLENPPVKGMFVYNSNPAVVAPNNPDVLRGFLRPDLFTVVHEQFFTDTARYADIILPATTFLEHKELNKAYGHTYLQISDQAIEPLGECRSNTEVFRALAQRMGFTEECFQEDVDQMIDQLLTIPEGVPNGWEKWMQGITRERLEREGHVRLNLGEGPFLPFAQGGFATASGKAELYSENLKKMGLDPVVSFVPPQESRHSAKAGTFPLELLGRKADNFLNSSFTNIPSIQKMEQPELLEIHTQDAERRGIREGDWVRVFNDRGEVRLKAHVNGAVQPGVVAARLNAARFTPDGKSINSLTSETLTDIGGGATFYSCLVDVEAINSVASLQTADDRG
ncbi:MAG TPA: molybdopterin oxidoreductase family protein [Candidatus Angelobacter sp.]|nr:molybdopterin oxidoreductase family protein [Candidatus Angelobacter sp.]